MTEPNGTETRPGATGVPPAREVAEHTRASRYVVASLSPAQVDMVRAVEDLLSLATGKQVAVVVYETQ